MKVLQTNLTSLLNTFIKLMHEHIKFIGVQYF
jgi:hypothetical protein